MSATYCVWPRRNRVTPTGEQTVETGSTIGRVHSIETCGTLDGPGIRYVVFLQGCLMRCKYCHNRDSWQTGIGRQMTVAQILDDLQHYRHFIRNGGITCSGGEALLQIDFVTELFHTCKQRGIHTCLDTNGFIRHLEERLDPLLDVTDLVLLDLKEMDDTRHFALTNVSNRYAIRFANILARRNHPTWIRHVVVPGHTDHPDSIRQLALFLRTLPNVERFELLPYHELGRFKWEGCGDAYPLADVSPPSPGRMREIAEEFNNLGIQPRF